MVLNERLTELMKVRAEFLMERAFPAFDDALDQKPDRVIIGGNSLNLVPGDIDIFPVNNDRFQLSPTAKNIVSLTRNAITVRTKDDHIVQFCNYSRIDLQTLIWSFDFAHIQIGAQFRLADTEYKFMNVDWTDDYVVARATNDSWYTGSNYPLSSLMRLQKYYQRRDISKKNASRAVVKILIDIMSRGFRGEEDFKDQLDAVDLAELLGGADKGANDGLTELFRLLNKVDNVKPKPAGKD